jgi:HSP20 family protein
MTIRRIRPVSRVAPNEGEVRRLMRLALSSGAEEVDLGAGWIPVIDIYETESDLVVEIEVPGMTTRDVVLALSASRIEVRGVKKEPAVAAAPRYLRLEREYGSFQRSVALPCAVAPDSARAVLANGVLRVSIRKLRGARDRDIVVKIQKNEA